MRARLCPIVLALAAVACGGAKLAEPPAQTPEAPPPAHHGLSELDALEHDLDVASERLGVELAQKERERAAPGPAREDDAQSTTEEAPQADKAARPGPKPESPAASKPRTKDGEPPADQPAGVAPGGIGSPCDVACRALGSMRRSAAKICELAGESSERCTRAKAKVAEAERRVGDAGCECKRDGGMLMSSRAE